MEYIQSPLFCHWIIDEKLVIKNDISWFKVYNQNDHQYGILKIITVNNKDSLTQEQIELTLNTVLKLAKETIDYQEVETHYLKEQDQVIQMDICLLTDLDHIKNTEELKLLLDSLFNKACQYYYEEDNEDKALKYFNIAATYGHVNAQYALANYYDWLDNEQNVKKAVYWFKKAAKQGELDSQKKLAQYYELGIGCKKDMKKSFYWYEQAANQNDFEAQYYVANFYEKGIGCQQDAKKAFYFYEKAAKQGYAKAQSDLGFCYQNGIGCTKDLDKALYWYKKAEAQNDMKAKFYIACLNKQL